VVFTSVQRELRGKQHYPAALEGIHSRSLIPNGQAVFAWHQLPQAEVVKSPESSGSPAEHTPSCIPQDAAHYLHF
jgi:hypothetical protein